MFHSRLVHGPALAAMAALGLLTAACTAASPSPSEAMGASVDVTLQEWSVVPSAESAPAGEVTFHVTNEGPEDVHEFVVLKTDLDAAELPTDDTGAVDEEGEGVEVAGEVEEVEVDASEDLTVTLEAGNYVLLCNIYDEDEDESHYAMGMRTPFTVE